MKYVADFETSHNNEKTWVWAFGLYNIESDIFQYGGSIDEFFRVVEKGKNKKIYFHNLKFDGEFIIYHLIKNGFTHIKDKKERKNRTFTTLINEMGMFYSIEVYFKIGNKKVSKVTFLDSLKILPFSVEQIAKAFNLEIKKLDMDYSIIRYENHKMNKEEIDYLENDCKIVGKALKVLFNENLESMTTGSNALKDYKKGLSDSKFSHYFPKLDSILDSEIRKSYKGGFTYLNPIYKEKDLENGTVIDVNSLYPYIMRYKPMPFGEPYFFEGEYKKDKVYSLYIQMITCSFELKKGKIPTIQIKNNRSFFRSNEYLESSKGEIICLTLTNIDLKLFFEQYNIYDLSFVAGWKFKQVEGIFNSYIDKWTERKINASIEGNQEQRTLSKLMLNSLYGKFATGLTAKSKEPYLEEDVVKYQITDEEEKDGLYIPIGSFITSYAREKTIRTSQEIRDYSIQKYGIDKYIYSDTDSIHSLLTIDEIEKICKVDKYELGCWAHESNFSKARFVRQKTYVEEIDGKLHITCAGMPSKCYEHVTFNNFREGFTCGGKLMFKHIKGGVILVDTEFTIKKELIGT